MTIGVGIRVLLADALGGKLLFFPVVVAVLVTSWYLGAGPALFGLVLGLAGTVVLLRPSTPAIDPTSLVASAVIGLATILLMETLRRSRARAVASAAEAHDAARRSREAEAVMAAQQTRLEDQARQLQDADRRKDAFLATLAHELRNPLAPIRNAAEVLRSRDVAPETAENARAMIERQVVVMARLLEDLLDVSRISRGEFHLRKEFVLLKDVVARAVEQSRPVLEANRLELSIALPAEPIHLEADPTRLAQVFANLLNNAAKYSEPGARATLTAQLRDGHVWVSVLDTGIGIAPESLPRLFEMFSQLAPMLERSRDGLGVGLSLAQALVEGHGGSIEARSDGLGRGSEFVVRLPVSERPAAPATPAAPERRAADPHRVLVVDDNRDAADSMSLILQFDGHDVRTAYDGEEALQVAETFRPRVVLLDIGLPLMNGYEVARALRALPWGKDVMLVAITGWGQDEDRRQALEAGFDRHLTKPVDPGAVTTLLAERSTSAAGARP